MCTCILLSIIIVIYIVIKTKDCQEKEKCEEQEIWRVPNSNPLQHVLQYLFVCFCGFSANHSVIFCKVLLLGSFLPT